MILDITRYPFSNFLTEAKQLWRLALPMMLASIAGVGIGVVDATMAGGAGKDDLTAVALGSALFATIYVTFIGIMTALNPLIAQMYGAGKTTEVGEMGRQGLWFGFLLGLVGMLLMLAAVSPLKNYVNFTPKIETMLGDYIIYTALAMPAAMLHRALHAYASSLNRPKPIMWVSWAALLLNVPLNYVFVYGKFGLPEMGGAGCGFATLLVFVFNAGALAAYVLSHKDLKPFGLGIRWCLPDWHTQKQIWQLGWPIGLSYFLEASLFTSIVWLITPFGTDTVSAQQIVISLSSVVYMIPQSLGAAATVRIGFSLGRRQFARARYISGTAVALGLLFALLTVSVLLLLRYPLIGLYTSDAAVIALASSLLFFSAVFQFFDFTQCISSYALRGYKITRIPMLIHAIAFWLLGLLPGYVFAFYLNMGIYGFWTALVLSLACAATALLWYLEKCSKWVVHHRGL
ncbi:MAG: MATE family efflux transporter [Alysiella sp.]|uniref:MATE family efflux transporter n=1 Tax=Alysiella sp. TaxID=1872483 RepID=UPI0026DB2830|nr:MATE family efflux transporter [Alysiella sp.]MDO4433176.1 MATE family efflux transporter [Alysiella sp.]